MLTTTKKVLLATLVASSLSACQSTSTKVTSNQDSPNINEVAQQQYNGPKARIAVARFTDKSNDSHWWRKEIGEGMADQLTTALVGTNRFIVLERQALDAVLSEQDLAASGRVSAASGAAYGEIEGAEIVVVAAVTEFDDDSSGASVGTGGFIGDVFSSVSAGFSGSHMAIDLRLIDTRTSRILAATSVEGGSKDFDFTSAATNFGGALVGGNLSGWSNTPKEKALREVIIKAVEFLQTKVPATYYRYNSNNTLAPGYTAPPPLTTTAAKSKAVAPVAKVDVPTHRMPHYEKMDLAMSRMNLVCLGYLKNQPDYEEFETEDVKYDRQTVIALREYQQEKQLKVSGLADEATKKSLDESQCIAKTNKSGLESLGSMFKIN
ncbi:peptidoglycan-binding protein [Pseudoalteromonas sp. SR44-5]|jgi:curli biogenesis system outer membrane secretion channel CsgG|uniref:Curli production assembly/transport component CsgG n=3 Tax=Pseudoalteromonas TaxID=53246 RepID=A0ABY3FDB5_9GAMM|nr:MULTISPECIES: CsgG/HfaB family protein [Pseudoalteromonas]MBB1292727.1 peptidoglycan-binding protein [Pseudoalteromonas sp. SR41-4]MBB1335216.1 peptidoglycan-binding protein [Pseudoalteromonas sp. SR41-6]MBB1368426.1 peptidoglycan-binding protein [Pseudoalteromonas sp. SR44-5]MBB1419025.1 peptidoglycan-binding protein [Pseudoalteromonas sp. SG44-1]MBB1423720.1 peptidoglycan-binding protein [Pseudoalteromonas sp. SG43-7]